MHHTRVGVLRGGPSNEYEVSLNSGKEVLKALREHLSDHYHPRDIFIDRDGTWHLDGISVRPEQALSKIDVAWNALHGAYGEDGKVQHILEAHGIPFTGSGSLSSAIGMNKVLTKKILRDHGIRTPSWKEFAAADVNDNGEAIAHRMFHTHILPVVVKPASSGSSVGVTLVRSYGDLLQAMQNAAAHSPTVIVEDYIPGLEATCAVIEGYRGQDLYTLPPIEIRPHNELFDYAAKYAGQSQEIVPGNFPGDIKKELQELSRTIHKIMNLRHYSRSDFIIHPRRGIYALEVNTLPGLSSESLVPRALHAVGGRLHDFVGHILALAHPRK